MFSCFFLASALFADTRPLKTYCQNEYLIVSAEAITVKRYPAQMQDSYALFEAKCSSCHSLKDSIKSDGVLPSYWQKIVEDMRTKPKAEISEDEGRRITAFLIYDSYHRRRREFRTALNKLPREEQAKEQEKINEVEKNVSEGEGRISEGEAKVSGLLKRDSNEHW